MKLKILFSFLLIFLVSSTYGQYENATSDSKNNDISNPKVEFEGKFSYTVRNANYLIELSISNGSYVEYNASGEVLSNGSFERTGDISYKLSPIEVFADAKISRVLEFKMKSRTSRDANLEIFSSSDESAGVLIISKVQ